MSLKERIEEKIHRHPDAEDNDIAKMIWEEDHPGETWENKGPSEQYVGRVRRKAQALAGPPEFEVEIPEEDEPPHPDYEEGEEPPDEEPPFQEAFEPPEIEYPETEPPVEGPTLDDVEFIVCFTFDKFADWTGFDGWRFQQDSKGRLTDKNEKRFVKLTSRMMDKYLPDIFDQYFLEVMFAYTAIMIVGSKGAAYRAWRKERRPKKEVKSTIVEETPPESTEASEIPDAEQPETSTEDEHEREPDTLPYGAKAQGEAEFTKRLRRQTG